MKNCFLDQYSKNSTIFINSGKTKASKTLNIRSIHNFIKYGIYKECINTQVEICLLAEENWYFFYFWAAFKYHIKNNWQFFKNDQHPLIWSPEILQKIYTNLYFLNIVSSMAWKTQNCDIKNYMKTWNKFPRLSQACPSFRFAKLVFTPCNPSMCCK